MIKKLFTVLFVVLLTATAVSAQWENQGAFPDTGWTGSTHGIAVDPDGKIWVSSFYLEIPWIQTDDTLDTSGLYVFNPDGTQADFSPVTIVATGGGFIVDTLRYQRGLAVGADGHIIYVNGYTSKGVANQMFKIDYRTGQGLAKFSFDTEIGQTPTSPGVADDGTIFVGPVVGGGSTKIAMFDSDLTYLGTAVEGPPNISRTLSVSPDGNTIYWHSFDALRTIVYSRADEFSPFDSVATVLEGLSVETSKWNPADGLLYISNDKRGDSSIVAGNGETVVTDSLAWYAFNPESGELTKAFDFVPIVEGVADMYLRGLAFSTDGNTAYIGTFSKAQDRIQKVVRTGVGVKEVDGAVPSEYSLSQNYPNPFNPATKISFSIPVSEQVSIKVYDILGKEVATLLNEFKSAGTYEVDFNASNLSSGLYVYTISSGKFLQSSKMMLLK